MAKDFEINMDEFIKALESTAELVGQGATQAIGDIKNDWTREARDIAPIDSGNLRKQIQGNVVGQGIEGAVEMQANASQGGSRFNYSYYIHEHDAGGKSLRTPGTVKKFLDESGEQRKDEWRKWLEDDIESAVKKAGW